MTRFTRESFPYFGLLLALYAVFYGAILLYSKGLPYVTDGNESFSVLWHAYNLLHFDIATSFGITDEASAYHAAAHPYLHTHQGNMPRLFGAAIYLLGARTVEAQIVVTTILVGTACLTLAYFSMRRLANPLFAFIFCALLITDYLQYAQWNVVTYRVWYAFLFYAVVYSVMRSGERGNRWAAAGLFGSYALLFYGELVFAGLVAIIGALFAAYWHRGRPRLVLRLWLVEFAGAALALGVLLAQLLAKFGPGVVRQDFTLTFIARNLSSDPALQQAAVRFFKDHGIVYLLNLSDASHLRNPLAFVKAQTSNIFQLYTPWLVLAIFVILGGFVLSVVLDRRFFADLARSLRGLRYDAGAWALLACALAVLVSVMPAGEGLGWADTMLALLAGIATAETAKRAPDRWRKLMGTFFHADALRALALGTGAFVLLSQPASLVVPARFALAVAAFAIHLGFRGPAVWAAPVTAILERMVARFPRPVLPSATGIYLSIPLSLFLALLLIRVSTGLELFGVRSNLPHSALHPLGIVLAAAAAVVIAFAAGRAFGGRWAARSAAPGLRFIALIGFVGLIAFATRQQGRLYDQAYAAVWTLPFDMHEAHGWGRATILAGVLLASAFIAFGWRRLLRPAEARPLVGPLVLLLIGEAAFAVIFYLSPGYVMSGYLGRSAPFAVYFTALPITAAFYLLAVLTLRARSAATASPRRRLQAILRPASRTRVPQLLSGALAAGLLASLSAYWVVLQSSYMGMLPPDHFAVLKELRKPPFSGQSSVLNTYAAPAAAMTGQWAYFDGFYFMNLIHRTASGYVVERDMQNYLWLADRDVNPDYHRPQLFVCLWPQTLRNVVADLGKGFQDFDNYCPRLPIVAAAAEGTGPMLHKLLAADRSPRGSWAVVRLDHELPPLVEGVTATLVRSGNRLSATVAYRYLQQDGTPEGRTIVELVGNPAAKDCSVGRKPVILASGGPRDRLEIPRGYSGTIVLRVTPVSLRKTGESVTSNVFRVQSGSAGFEACPYSGWMDFAVGVRSSHG